jgi:hypothetical protein
MKYPKITEIVKKRNLALLLRFENGICKEIDFHQLAERPIFADLQNPVFFRSARVDQGGGGIVWNDDLDISEAYCWEQGTAVSEQTIA